MADRHRRLGYHRNTPYSKVIPKENSIFTRVQSQNNFRGRLVFLLTAYTPDVSYTTLQNAVDYIGSFLRVTSTGAHKPGDPGVILNEYRLSIDNEVIVEGYYTSESSAKKALAELAIEGLKKTCFSIIRKIHPRSSPQVHIPLSNTEASGSSTSSTCQEKKQIPTTSLTGGIGEKIMKQMGWSGAGLGAQEQGNIAIVENTIQIARRGLGSNDISTEVRNILKTHAASRSVNSISFSNDFSKEERSIIHQLARQLNLKSRSYGKGNDRTLVVQSKMRLIDLVKCLLDVGGENEQYKLVLPLNFDK